MKTDQRGPEAGGKAGLKRWLAVACIGFLLAEVVLVLLSWILSATGMDGVRSLLSSEGIRWFFGNFTAMQATPPLVWLVLMLVALGCLQRSGVLAMRRTIYRDRIALRSALLLIVGYLVVIALLTAIPHAILLSVTGSLFPSAFSRSLVAVVAFGIAIFCLAFGVMSGRIRTLSEVLDALSFGISKGAPLFILYILVVQFFHSLWFVFGE